MRTATFPLLSSALLLAAAGAALAAPAPAADPVEVRLIAEHTALVRGRQEQFGLLLEHQPHWHTYWINPGDSGLPTTLAWTLPPGYQAGDVDWPTPRRFEVGGLYNFGYDGQTLLPVSISVPADAPAGSTAHVAVEVKWLVCREECVPGKASLALDLPVVAETATPDPRWIKQYSDARLAQPQATAWKGAVDASGDRVRVTLTGPGLPPQGAKLDAFAAERKLFDNKPPAIRRDGEALVIEAGKSEYFTAPPAELHLLVTTQSADGPRSWRVRLPFAGETAAAAR